MNDLPLEAVVSGHGVVDRAQRLLRERIVLLTSEVDDAAADQVVGQLLLMEQADPTADIHFYLNSPGGGVTAGMAIFDTMRHIRPDVVTWAAGLAAGIAAVLLSNGAPGKRYALPHAKIMMMKPSWPADPTPAQLDMLARTTDEMTAIVATQTGQPVEQVAADAAAGRWFTAEEALAYGLVDGIRDRLGRNPQ
ncbi:ATP-dependent Clp protease proteolytic subunit [Actinosynnema sp. NPDC049800]